MIMKGIAPCSLGQLCTWLSGRQQTALCPFGLHSPFEGFYPKMEISGFFWEIFNIGQTGPDFLHGNTIGWE